ncbi:MAG: hypothetical protein P8O06_05555 [Porticoccaceae bacterium]|nr:hypothetical protein [Porticoccaceae bacterium]
MDTKVFDFSFRPFVYQRTLHLRKEEIDQGISFHLKRKRSKHDFPQIVWRFLETYYRFKYWYFFRRFERLADQCNPKCIAIFNGHRLPEQAVKNMARQKSIPVVHFENGLLPNTTTFDLSGVNDDNNVPRTSAFYQQYCLSGTSQRPVEKVLVQRQFHRAKVSHAQKDDFHRPLPERFVFVPFQVLFDSQVLINSPRLKNMRELYEWINFVASNCTDVNLQFVIKEHPSDPHRYDDLYHANSRIMFSNRDTTELIKSAEAVVTINSSVGLESLLLDKRVFVLGNACFAIDGITKPIMTPDQLAQEINRLSSWHVNKELIEKYIDYLANVYCIPQSWREPNKIHINALEQRFKAVITG